MVGCTAEADLGAWYISKSKVVSLDRGGKLDVRVALVVGC